MSTIETGEKNLGINFAEIGIKRKFNKEKLEL